MSSLHELNLDAVSAEERSYLLGLFLADGCVYYSRRKDRTYVSHRIKFFLQGDQLEIAEKVVALLKKLIGVSPHIYWEAGCMWILKFESKALFAFLPKKERLLNDNSARDRFFSDNRLFDVENGIPFLAGLLDGDGSCEVRVQKKQCMLGSVQKWNWSFSQSKLLFLIDYIRTLVTSMTSDEYSIGIRLRPGRNETKLCIRKSGILALLNSGIVNYSWKVRKWLERVGEIQRNRASYHTVGQVAKMLDVSEYIVRRCVSQNRLTCLRGPVESRGFALSWRYITTDAVEKLRGELAKEKNRSERIGKEGLRVLDAAKELSISYSTLQHWCHDGKIRSTMLHEGTCRFLVIPRDELETLRDRMRRKHSPHVSSEPAYRFNQTF